jgi:hypothetical protein
VGPISSDEEAVLARLDAAFAGQRAALSARQLGVVRAWQRTAREYELAQAVARGTADRGPLSPLVVEQVLEFQRGLDGAIRTARLPFDLTVYRGIRSLRRTFGVDDPADIGCESREFEGYTATSVLRQVAIEEFTAPAGALMEVVVGAGTPALWVAGVGTVRLRRQGELLFGTRLHIRVVGYRQESGLPVLAVEVIAG